MCGHQRSMVRDLCGQIRCPGRGVVYESGRTSQPDGVLRWPLQLPIGFTLHFRAWELASENRCPRSQTGGSLHGVSTTRRAGAHNVLDLGFYPFQLHMDPRSAVEATVDRPILTECPCAFGHGERQF
jgi:hypothetical protein